MPRDSNGNYTLPTDSNPVITETVIESTWANETLGDVADALTDSLAADGSKLPIQNLPMGGFVHTGVGNPTARDQYLSVGYDQDGVANRVTLVGVPTDNLVGTMLGSPPSYTAGMIISFFATATNTGAMTLKIGGLAAKSLVNNLELTMPAGAVDAGEFYQAYYDGSQFVMNTDTTGNVNIKLNATTGSIRPTATGAYPSLTLTGNTVNVPAGSGWIVPAGGAGATGAVLITWTTKTAVTLSYLASSYSTTLGIDVNGNLVQYPGKPSKAAFRSVIMVGVVTHFNSTAQRVSTIPNIVFDDPYLGKDIANTLSNILTSGGRVSRSGALTVDVGAATAQHIGGDQTTYDSPNSINIAGGTAVQFWTLYGSGSPTLSGAVTATVPTANYDLAGTLTALTGGYTCIHRLYYLGGEYVFVYGQEQYATMDAALARLPVTRGRFNLSPYMSDAILLCEIAITQGTTDLNNAYFINVGGPNYSIGSAGGIAEAPIDGAAYGRKNAAWAQVLAATDPQIINGSGTTITGPNPKLSLVGTGSAGISSFSIKNGSHAWVGIEADFSANLLYLRGYNPSTGSLVCTITYDLATGKFTLPAGLEVTAAAVLDSTLSVAGAASLLAALTVTGVLTANSALNVAGFAAFSNNMSIAGFLNVAAQLTVTGFSALNGGGSTLTRALNDASTNIADTAFVQNELKAIPLFYGTATSSQSALSFGAFSFTSSFINGVGSWSGVSYTAAIGGYYRVKSTMIYSNTAIGQLPAYAYVGKTPNGGASGQYSPISTTIIQPGTSDSVDVDAIVPLNVGDQVFISGNPAAFLATTFAAGVGSSVSVERIAKF